MMGSGKILEEVEKVVGELKQSFCSGLTEKFYIIS